MESLGLDYWLYATVHPDVFESLACCLESKQHARLSSSSLYCGADESLNVKRDSPADVVFQGFPVD